MLGWNISVYRGAPDPDQRDSSAASDGIRLGVWQTGVGGLDWINDLVSAGRAVDLGGDGYPHRYRASARDVLPVLRGGPPGAKRTWSADPWDILLPGWEGATRIDHPALDECPAEEWLLIEAWDES